MRPQTRNDSGEPAECGVRDAAQAERMIAELATKQHGVVTVRQLHDAGFSSSAIKRRLRAARLHRLHRGVYLVGHAATADGAIELAAVMASGDGSAASHRSAARLLAFSLLLSWRTPVEVTVPGRDPGVKRGIRVYRVRDLDKRDVRSVRGIPVTSPARTLLDLAAILPMQELESVVAEARKRRLVRDQDLADQLERNRGRRGAAALRRLIELERRPALTRSEAERRFVALLRAATLPEPEANTRIFRMEVDFLWRKERVVVEIDGYAFHSAPRAFEHDRERDAILVANGYAVIRITWRQLVERPVSVIAKIAAALAVRSIGR